MRTAYDLFLCSPARFQPTFSFARRTIACCLRVATLTLMMIAVVTGLSGYPTPKSALAGRPQSSTSATTTTLVSSPDPSYSSQSLTLTATVTSQATGTPTGTVTFLDGTTQLGQVALDTNGLAQFLGADLRIWAASFCCDRKASFHEILTFLEYSHLCCNDLMKVCQKQMLRCQVIACVHRPVA